MASLKLTEAVVKALPFATEKQEFYFDTALKGFGLRVSRDTKSFIAERRIAGKTRRITIGPFPHIPVEKARRAAQGVLGELALGIDRRAFERVTLPRFHVHQIVGKF